tara:strand:+ start:87 stop:200 length:114 start_codon:yes stop_codon:yes gene_type:complete
MQLGETVLKKSEYGFSLKLKNQKAAKNNKFNGKLNEA